jgi:hypothetical protein
VTVKRTAASPPAATENGAFVGVTENPGGSSRLNVPEPPRTLRTVTSRGRVDASGKRSIPAEVSTVTAGSTSRRR